jgi:hypothetical protein
MIAVNGEISSDEFLDNSVVVSHHVSVVSSPVKLGITLNWLGVSVLVAIDKSSNSRDLSNEVHGIFVEGLPVVLLGDFAFIVEMSELGGLLEIEDSHGEHGHRVELVGERKNELDDIIFDVSSVLPFNLEGFDLSLSGEVSSHQQPEDTFREGLLVELILSSGISLGEEFLELRDGVSSEDNSLVRVATGQVTHESLHASHTTNNLLDSVVTDNLIAVLFLDLLELSLLLGDDLGQDLLEVGVGKLSLALSRKASLLQ